MNKSLWVRKISAFLSYRLPVYLARLTHGAPSEQPIPNLSGRKGLRFLVVKLDGAGDVILASPIFRWLKEAFPDSSCVLVVKARNRALVEHNPFIDEVLSPRDTKRKSMRALGEAWEMLTLYRSRLSKMQFDAVLFPRWDSDVSHGTLLLTLVNSPVKIGYVDRTTSSKLDFNRGLERSFTARLPAGVHKHELTRNLGPVKALLEASGINRENAVPSVEVFVSAADREFARETLRQVPQGSRPLVIAIGAQEVCRVWPMERWVETLRLLEKDYKLYPIILCIGSDRPNAEKLRAGLDDEALILDRTTWTQAAAIMESVDLVLANDSGMGHVASGLKTTSLVVVCSHPAVDFDPVGDKVEVIHSPLLAPCSVRCSAPEPHCILHVTPADVAAKVRKFFN